MATENIPHDVVIVEILFRLPVKDLVRFKCVAKAWRTTIDDPDFVKKHLDHSLRTASNVGVVIRESKLLWLSLDSFDSVVRLRHPLYAGPLSGRATELLGSCNGLIALSNGYDQISIWNPWTKRYRTLPSLSPGYSCRPQPGFPSYRTVVHGFGHDPIGNDYKLVSTIQCLVGVDSFKSAVVVYSAKTHTRKKINDFPYYIRPRVWDNPRKHGVLASNALHWVVSRTPKPEDSTFVAAFDLSTEEYREVPIPDFTITYDRESHIVLDVEALGGSLCVICNLRYIYEGVDIWVMKEYGIRESWTKLFSVSASGEIGKFDYFLPLAYLKGGGSRVLANIGDRRIATYDLETEKAEKLKQYYAPHFMKTLVCVESLVGLGQIGWKTGKEWRKLRQNHRRLIRMMRGVVQFS